MQTEKEKLDLVVFDFYRVEQNGLKEVIIDDFKNSSLKNNPELLLTINLGPCNKLYKREIITNNKKLGVFAKDFRMYFLVGQQSAKWGIADPQETTFLLL